MDIKGVYANRISFIELLIYATEMSGTENPTYGDPIYFWMRFGFDEKNKIIKEAKTFIILNKPISPQHFL